MYTNNSKILPIVTALLLVVATGASPAIAEVVIHEVQVVDSTGSSGGPPELLIIWGTEFGGDPVINLGTLGPALTLPLDQSLCTLTPPPPLASGFDCVVAALPAPIPDGDYLLWLEGGAAAAGCDSECGQKPTLLRFEFTGEDCSAGNHMQEDHCIGTVGPATSPVDIVVTKKADRIDVSPSTGIFPGDIITVSPAAGRNKLQSSLKFDVFEPPAGAGWEQSNDIHTSCSQPINVGDQFGSMLLVEFIGPPGDCEPVRPPPTTI